MFLKLLRLAVLIVVTGENVIGLSAVASPTEAMKFCQIVPDIIDVEPKVEATVIFPSGVRMLMGAELTPTQVKDQPVNISFAGLDSHSLYTLTFDDPDVPNRADQRKAEFLHWLVVNIPAGGQFLDTTKGDTYTEYVGSGPWLGSAFHRYTLLIFKQANRLTLNRTRVSNHSKEGRIGFKVREFAKQYSLGNPVAGNFFHAQFDSSVPNITKQLSGKWRDKGIYKKIVCVNG